MPVKVRRASIIRSTLIVAVAIVTLRFAAPGTASDTNGGETTTRPDDVIAVLVFTKTAGFRHDSIPDGLEAIGTFVKRNRKLMILSTEDSHIFHDDILSGTDVVVFLNTTGDILIDDQQAAFERFMQRGGGFVGVHAATDTEYDWPWYGKLVGACFRSHPAVQEATIIVEDRAHPSTEHLEDEWTRTDEWYDFRANPRPNVHVLMSLNEHSYEGGGMGEDHPIAWCHEFDGGRAWYTGLGHTKESYQEEAFLKHLLGGILWAAGENESSRPRDKSPRPAGE